MQTPGRPDTDPDAHSASISLDASDWLQQFIKHVEINFVDASEGLPPDAALPTFQAMAMQAVIQTLQDSGLSREDVLELLGRISLEQKVVYGEWTPDLNQRRFALIDKEMGGTLTLAEQIELARLTTKMRQHVESELDLPLEGVKGLHRKLIEQSATERIR